jgi:hypothetical protein
MLPFFREKREGKHTRRIEYYSTTFGLFDFPRFVFSGQGKKRTDQSRGENKKVATPEV